MSPAQRADKRCRRPVGTEQRVVAGIGVSLQDTAIAGEMLDRMLGAAGPRVMEQGGWRRGTAERSIVANIGPQPPDIGLGLRQHRHGGIVAVEPLGGENMGLDQQVERSQRRGAGADLIRERREADVYAFACGKASNGDPI